MGLIGKPDGECEDSDRGEPDKAAETRALVLVGWGWIDRGRGTCYDYRVSSFWRTRTVYNLPVE